MRMKLSLCVLGALLLLICASSRGQYPTIEGVGATISFDGQPTMDSSMSADGCIVFSYQGKYVFEMLKACNFANTGGLSDEQLQTSATDGIKSDFKITITNATVAGLPGKKFDGNKLSDPGEGANIWGEVTSIRNGSGARVYIVTVIQTGLVNKLSDEDKLRRQVSLFLGTLAIRNQPLADAK